MNKSITDTSIETTSLIPESALSSNGEPQWLHEMRIAALKDYNEAALPPRGVALWRYTDPTRFLIDPDQLVAKSSSDSCHELAVSDRDRVDIDRVAALVTDCCGREIEINAGSNLGDKVILSSLISAMDTHEDLIRKYLGQLVNSKTGKFEATNTALWQDGLFVYVPDNTAVEKPIHLLRYACGAGTTYLPRLLVVLGRNARLTLIDEYIGGSAMTDDGYAAVNGAVEIFGGENSRCNYVSLQRQATGTRMYLSHRSRIERGAGAFTIPLALGGGISKQSFGVDLNGEGAESNIYGLLFGAGRQQFDNHTLHHHGAGHTISNIDFKVVLRDKARSAYTGLIRIDQPARACEAYQENRNLLLNTGTRAETIPELEILNEDVQCSHGATIGPVDPEMVFFLEARGIAREQAIAMIVSGFVAGTLEHIPETLRNRLVEVVRKRLEEN
ncbi:MAG: Fe-S cluster assembly protein SufD [candidate division Zixibacteria bacterium]|nr:Fe-S cluster assembly protein SufD [candidate division Zixibacteria bacterium]